MYTYNYIHIWRPALDVKNPPANNYGHRVRWHVTLVFILCSKPEEYGKVAKDHSRYGGKQIGTNWPKHGKTIDTYFQKEHKWVYQGCKFNDRLLYATQQQVKANGFLTSDFSRRCATHPHLHCNSS